MFICDNVYIYIHIYIYTYTYTHIHTCMLTPKKMRVKIVWSAVSTTLYFHVGGFDSLCLKWSAEPPTIEIYILFIHHIYTICVYIYIYICSGAPLGPTFSNASLHIIIINQIVI